MISCENVTFFYSKKISVLKDVSLSVPNGKFVALLGGNGAGKSTLVKVLSGYLNPSKGKIFYSGNNIEKVKPAKLAEIRAVLDQESALNFGYTVMQTIMLGGFARGADESSKSDRAFAKKCLTETGLENFEQRIYTELSGGEKRRVQIARAVFQLGENVKGKNILLDEPVSGLDPAHSNMAMKCARRLANEGASVMAVLHNAALAANYADEILLMKSGTIIHRGTPKEVLTPEKIYDTYGAKCEILHSNNGRIIVDFPPD